MIRRFALLSAALHLSVAMAIVHRNPLHLAAPSTTLRATLMASLANEPERQQSANRSGQSPADALPLPTESTSAMRIAATDAGATDSAPDRRDSQNEASCNQAIINHLLTELRTALDARFIYPPIARRHGWQGQVQLGLTIDADGHLSELSVLSSSGYPVLDADAVRTVARIGFLPRAADVLAGRTVRLQMPVFYRLIES